MFFLGISAHLMIYLLVPAFIIVFFYFKSIPGNPEAVHLLPVVVHYELVSPAHTTEKGYACYFRRKKSLCPKVNFLSCKFPPEEVCCVYQEIYYLSPVRSHSLLRAPPALLFF